MLAVSPSDCEAFHSGWPDQPVNAWSALGFVVVGVWLMTRPGSAPLRRWVGAAAALVGLGSILFHGRRGDLQDFIHDWSIAVLLLSLGVLVGAERPRAASWLGVAAVVIGVLFAVAPGLDEGVTLALAIGLVVLALVRRWALRPRPLAGAVGSAVLGVALTLAGRTDGVLCDPDALLQPHAAWHLLGALAVWLFVLAVPGSGIESASGQREG